MLLAMALMNPVEPDNLGVQRLTICDIQKGESDCGSRCQRGVLLCCVCEVASGTALPLLDSGQDLAPLALCAIEIQTLIS